MSNSFLQGMRVWRNCTTNQCITRCLEFSPNEMHYLLDVHLIVVVVVVIFMLVVFVKIVQRSREKLHSKFNCIVGACVQQPNRTGACVVWMQLQHICSDVAHQNRCKCSRVCPCEGEFSLHNKSSISGKYSDET